jgi:hypothetical protein
LLDILRFTRSQRYLEIHFEQTSCYTTDFSNHPRGNIHSIVPVKIHIELQLGTAKGFPASGQVWIVVQTLEKVTKQELISGLDWWCQPNINSKVHPAMCMLSLHVSLQAMHPTLSEMLELPEDEEESDKSEN